jgi:hypothetical protein
MDKMIKNTHNNKPQPQKFLTFVIVNSLRGQGILIYGNKENYRKRNKTLFKVIFWCFRIN